MSNPASITVTSLTANGGTNQPAVQTVDTDGTINCDLGGKFDRVVFELINAAAAACTVTFKAGTSAAAHQSKDLAITLAATGNAAAKQIVGPFESSRFMKTDGTLDVAFLAASSTPNVTVRCYRLPKQYV